MSSLRLGSPLATDHQREWTAKNAASVPCGASARPMCDELAAPVGPQRTAPSWQMPIDHGTVCTSAG